MPLYKQIARGIRDEGEARIAGGEGTLHVECARRMLPAQRGELGDFALILVEILTRVQGYAIDGIAQGGLLPVQIGDLELADPAAQHQRDPVLLIQDVFEVAEAVILRGVIVDRVRASVGRLDP